jgi:hypothetical protein
MAAYQKLSPILSGTPGGHLRFWCPGCQTFHGLRVAPSEGAWGWNGDPLRPTFTPSVLVTSGHYVDGHQGDCWCNFREREGRESSFHCYRCHSFITDGRIAFLSDCTHALAGQTVDLPEIPESSAG